MPKIILPRKSFTTFYISKFLNFTEDAGFWMEEAELASWDPETNNRYSSAFTAEEKVADLIYEYICLLL